MHVFRFLEKLFGRKKADSRPEGTGTGMEGSETGANTDELPVHQKSKEEKPHPIRSAAPSQAPHESVTVPKTAAVKPPAGDPTAAAFVEVPAHPKY